jgi:hypothetical protein
MKLKVTARAFNLAVAAFAAAALGFAVFAMPRELFEELVAGTGLPALISSAEAPLGVKARLVAAAGGGGVLLVLTWSLLTLLDRVARKAPAKPAEDDFFDLGFDPPRLRRADAHPDAPSRHPIRAGREFGEPVDPVTEEEPAEPQPPAFPDELPAFLTEDEADQADADEVAAAGEAAPDGDAIDAPIHGSAVADAEDDDHFEPLELAGFESAIEAAAPTDPFDPMEDSAMPPLMAEELLEPTEAEVVSEEIEDEPHEGVGQEIPVARIRPQEDQGESISSLLQRLDTGFGECEWPLAEGGSAPPLRELDDRLRNALDGLQKMASRNGS